MKIKPYHLVILMVVLFFCAAYFRIMSSLELRLEDSFYQKRSTIDTRIVIAGIDEPSLERLGRWPWGRDKLAKLIAAVSRGKPAVIGIDIILSEPASDPIEDDILSAAVKEAKNVVLPVYGVLEKKTRSGQVIVQQLQEPIPGLKQYSHIGHINTVPDEDGIVRKTLLNFTYKGTEVPSFAWSIFREYLDGMGKTADISKVPLDSFKRMEVSYAGIPGDYEMLSIYRVLNGEIPPEYFENKIVLVGPYTAGIHDYYFTPLAHESPMYGVEIHANILQSLLNSNFKREIPFPFTVAILLISGFIGYMIFSRVSPFKSIVILISIVCAYLLLGVWLYRAGIIIPIFYPVTLLTLSYFIFLAYRYLNEQLEKKRITGIFSRYVAPQVVDKILKEGEEALRLGGTRREITALFVDIRGFTPLSESARPEEVVEILNDYLSLCASSIFTYEGTLDKFIGDAAMALFNAPLDLDDHTFKAVQAAWAMKTGAAKLEDKLQEQFGRTVHFGIGINTGIAVVGNIGASFRMDYTAIGDTVNTAARLESNAKEGQILLSQAAYERVKDRVMCTCLGEISVKGKSQGLTVYQLDGIA